MIAALLASLALVAQDPASAQTAPQSHDEPVALEDVEVTGRSLERLIADFVGEVAAPNRNRGLARWTGTVCVGVVNLRAEAAQYLADRISTVAEDLGLRTGAPGCTPNILVVATDDGGSLATKLVEEHGRAFRMGGAGMDRGGAALRDFQQTERPVRWWQLSLPIDSETGDRAVRLPGECVSPCSSSVHYAPVISVSSATRLRTQIVDNLFRTIVAVDVDSVSQVSITQLADYIAMISLAQIDPDADTRAYASILNVFDDPTDSQSLTDWDKAYLSGLYDAQRIAANRRAARSEVVASIRQAHRDLRRTSTDETTAD